jgi:rare lipoprotein A
VVKNKRKSKILYLLLCCLVLFSTSVYAQNKDKKLIHNRATYYHDRFENRRTTSGEKFSQKEYTAAHKTLPINTIVKVTNKKNGRVVFLKINDRCPRKGVIDMSKIAAKRIRLNQSGSASVSIEVLGDEYLDLWQKQDDIFEMFDRSDMNDSLRQEYFDSVIFAKENKVQENFLFTYYIRIATAQGRLEAKSIIHQIPQKYQNNAKAVKVYNENFYYINIGPFISQETAVAAINELKKNYPLTHLIKKKMK